MSKPQDKEKALMTLRHHPEGLTTSRLETETGIGERTLRTYLNELWDEGKVEKDGWTWTAPDYKPTRLRSLELSPEEAMTLYLASRLFVKQHDKRNDSAQTALMKLADILTGDAGVGNEIYQAAKELSQRADSGNYNRVFNAVMQAYIYRRRLSIIYAPAEASEFPTEFEPYLIEPSAIGYSTYVIGRSSIVKAIRTYKLERIQSVTLLTGNDNSYIIPADFPGLDILQNAWTIYHGEKTETVILRFSPAVRKRVLETRWHPSQEDPIEDPEKQGWLRWTAHLAGLTDITPWVRSWGADCEVLKPEELRQHLKRETKRLITLYQSENVPATLPHELLWAKIDRKRPKEIHRLRYHLIDVGKCALALWEIAFPAVLKRQVVAWLDVSEPDEAGRLFAFWAALHDLGKASPVFQWHRHVQNAKLRDQLKAELEQAGFKFPSALPQIDAHHATITAWALRDDKENLLPQFNRKLVQQFALAIGGHHGAWPLSNAISNMHQDNSGKALAGWREARQKLVEELLTVFQPPVIEKFELEIESQNALLTLLSGVVAVADWLGSDEKIFGYESDLYSTAEYVVRAKDNARQALSKHQWRGLPDLLPAYGFSDLFPDKIPHAAQTQALRAVAPLTPPVLVILEAPMGSGKTESALGIYAHWAHTADLRGLYVAMPTMATSNQMHDRVSDFLQRVYGADIEPMLIHSRAALKDALLDDTHQEGAEQGERAAALAWFLPRKQSLLFPFGVGTVDQALMSVLQTKHFFVRLLGLSHKVIIFDEVHAYDAYMNTLFKRLLEWLRQVGASVIILSATLPDKTRRELAEAFGAPADSLPPQTYPRLTWAAQGQAGAVALPAPAIPRRLALEWMGREPQAIVERLRAELADGGCAAVVCNTVKRAQEIYQLLEQINNAEHWVTDDNLILFHARFPFAWRDEREKNVRAKFGPPEKAPNRPQKAIVIATQVIEQSLDLDFDVMISDFAPADLLLQRAGRLHRHPRPRHHPDRLLIAAPTEEDGVPQFDRADKDYIYEHFVLLRSWLALKRQNGLVTLPNELSELIEWTYDESREFAEATEAMREMLKKAKEKMKDTNRADKLKAQGRLVVKPNDADFILSENDTLEEDDPNVAEAFQAMTRADPPGISLVCIHRTDNGDALDPKDRSTISTKFFQPDGETALRLASHTVTVQHWEVIRYFSSNEHLPPAWKKIAALRYHRLAIFNTAGNCPLEGKPYTLHLTRELGLEILKQEAA